jgi:alanyl-tRNA synthetase
MLGNWSLGDYFKSGAIAMSFEFLTQELGFNPKNLYVTVFEGDQDAARDEEAIIYWQDVFKKAGIEAKLNERIFVYGKKQNWWGPAGQTGPCGPCTEMFYDTGKTHDPRFGEKCHPDCGCGKYVEIWNDVFMEFNKTATGKFEPLTQKNVDTGLGLERVTAILQEKPSHFETELFVNIVNKVKQLAQTANTESIRIIADHLRAATFVLADKVSPGNVDQGYVLRRLIRRSIRHGHKMGIADYFTHLIAEIVIADYRDVYPELEKGRDFIFTALREEEQKFSETIKHGEKEFRKILPQIKQREKQELSGDKAFYLYETYGFPIEMTEELAREEGISVDLEGFSRAFKQHQELSRKGAEQKFRGGLADHTEKTTALHTATHLLHQALRMVLGNQVEQRGSNITADRLRFDFSYEDKLTPEQLREVEMIVNKVIADDLPVQFAEMTVDEAKKAGAIGLFEHKYGQKVKVYTVGDPARGNVFSMEICGGPHIARTGVLKLFKITKEQSSSAGVRRIKAIIG